jgi:hypothetical protein
VPSGTSVVQVTLEVPAVKLDARGQIAAGEECSGVELMAYEGVNIAKSHTKRDEAKISNCDASGAPVTDPTKRRLVVARTNPTAGTWDLHVFGTYKYARSKYKLRVDYVTASSSVESIAGPVSALNGSVTWTVREASVAVQPSSTKSTLTLSGLYAETQAQVAHHGNTVVQGPLGQLRAYPADTKKVTITTGGSSGNDIDLVILECNAGATNIDDASCTEVASSGGSSDVERAQFEPKAGKVYAVRVDGYEVSDAGNFVSTETLEMTPENGTVSVSGAHPTFTIAHSLTADQLATSALLTSRLFTEGKYAVAGALTLRTDDEVVLGAVPVRVAAPAAP